MASLRQRRLKRQRGVLIVLATFAWKYAHTISPNSDRSRIPRCRSAICVLPGGAKTRGPSALMHVLRERWTLDL
jgi:hypothetical protein